MKITIAAVGKLKEAFFTDAVKEYSKRLGRYCKLELLEAADEKTPDGASEAMENQIKAREGERILRLIPGDAYTIALVVVGEKLTSEGLALKIERLGISGQSHLCFIIGGSLGLDKRVLDRADFLLSFSDMTFPHQLMRVILLEQIYRSFKIIQHEPYHK